jgi:cation:H+ antiporter
VTLPLLGALVAGMVVLVGGAELVVRGASRLARALGMSPLLVGLTLVAFGTSAPEIAVSVEASLMGQGALALGNVAGSNIFNVLLVIGASAVVAPLMVERQLIRMDIPVLIGVSFLPVLFGADFVLDRAEGFVLLALGVAYVVGIILLAFRTEGTADRDAPTRGRPSRPGGRPATEGWGARAVEGAMILGGLIGLVVGAEWFITAAAEVARALGVSELVIGLTLVAGATSLPEAATSILAAARGERDLAVGNAVGSNIFNILFVLGAASVVAPGGLDVPLGALTFDFPIVIAVAVACVPVFLTGWQISRGEGMVFVLYYVIYMVYLLLKASTHHAQDEFATAILFFVAPLTAIVAVGGWWWGLRNSEA